ncbi:aminotransferase class I/II-fold pyridoxal phosphate-dependent enzyme [Kordiimonas marina]|uniref:aminotransferase class I/II-fold pyridoxal phosphate-dependent enzyme n=1 Tax=Kordiimonas marina TaxID=2872312 RepID=UPI001FF21E70|nr:aminotransferase class I/II-fold pyridoxal phosphate-dependent enzyme [Kordiimonas marina]MCJ9428340.1 aminotransferase class I/II-fold pyridoxal phosphate-dependent enzyme [Kordiimonas marina]
MLSLNHFAVQKLAALEAKNQCRRLVDTERTAAMALSVAGGPSLISFTDNDYLGLSTHPDVVEAARDAAARYGAGAGASRLVTGNHPLYAALEAKIAAIKGTEDACVFGSGYLANVGIIPTLVGKDDLILADELVHTCIHAGMQLSRARVLTFRHNDVAHATELMARERGNHGRALIVVDGVYSMDGDIAPLKDLGELALAHDAWLMNDDAHALGTIGGGRGSAHATGAEGLVPLQMGTLSKGVGAYGGYLAASKPVIDLMKTRARSFIYTTGLPPAAVGAALKALELIESDAEMVARPVKLARTFASAMGLPTPETPIVPLVIGTETDALAASARLADEGFKVIAFRPPTVPEGTSRLRFSFSASHRDEDVARLIEVATKLGLNR